MYRYKVHTNAAVVDLQFAEKWEAAEILTMIKDNQGVISPDVYIAPAAVAAIYYTPSEPV